MPELPEAERARQTLEDAVVGRRVAAVDDTDTYVCRPHAPGEIAGALAGRTFVSAHRRGKFLWLETDGGPTLGLHLGMAGSIRTEPAAKPLWDRFTLHLDDGTAVHLRDKRRLGRAVLDPDHDHIGPDAALISRDAFRTRVGRGTAPLKARLLDQSALSGVGNLLADETLWQAQLSPRRPAGELTVDELDHLRRVLRRATRAAIAHGGVHTGEFIAHRTRDGRCPRCGTILDRATIGGRTTFWCPECQPG